MPALMVKALAFDVFGTVVDWRSGIRREAGPFLERHALRTVDPGDFADAWRARYQPAMEEVRSGRRPYTRLDVLHRENLTALLERYGLDVAALPAEEIDALNLAWHRLDPWPDAVAGIARLKQRYIVAPLSNGNLALQVNLARRAGLPWDAILGADIARAYKPAPECYLRSADALGLAPQQVLMVAAHPADLDAARSCGLRTAYVPRPEEFGSGTEPSAVREPPFRHGFDLTARDFLDLAEQLKVIHDQC